MDGRQPKQSVTCPTCGTTFLAYASRIARGQAKYCSAACFYEAVTTSVALSCDYCGTVFKRQPRRVFAHNFCSRRCKAAFTRQNSAGVKHLANGRVLIRRPDHPHATAHGYVYRYRLILEETIGRYLRPDEIVHHINGDFTDDHPENLMVMSFSQHGTHHTRERARDATGKW